MRNRWIPENMDILLDDHPSVSDGRRRQGLITTFVVVLYLIADWVPYSWFVNRHTSMLEPEPKGDSIEVSLAF